MNPQPPLKGSPCPVKGCAAFAKPGRFMCLAHWRRVPKALNRAVFDTYEAWIRARRDDPGGPGMAQATASYRQARDAARSAVEAKEAEERA